eukprot:Clim_evm41s198 gene=Clim_evmTU41s198
MPSRALAKPTVPRWAKDLGILVGLAAIAFAIAVYALPVLGITHNPEDFSEDPRVPECKKHEYRMGRKCLTADQAENMVVFVHDYVADYLEQVAGHVDCYPEEYEEDWNGNLTTIEVEELIYTIIPFDWRTKQSEKDLAIRDLVMLTADCIEDRNMFVTKNSVQPTGTGPSSDEWDRAAASELARVKSAVSDPDEIYPPSIAVIDRKYWTALEVKRPFWCRFRRAVEHTVAIISQYLVTTALIVGGLAVVVSIVRYYLGRRRTHRQLVDRISDEVIEKLRYGNDDTEYVIDHLRDDAYDVERSHGQRISRAQFAKIWADVEKSVGQDTRIQKVQVTRKGIPAMAFRWVAHR